MIVCNLQFRHNNVNCKKQKNSSNLRSFKDEKSCNFKLSFHKQQKKIKKLGKELDSNQFMTM
jgi:hypothetical protein